MVRRPQKRAGQLAEHRAAEQRDALVTNALALGVAVQTLHTALVISVNTDHEAGSQLFLILYASG